MAFRPSQRSLRPRVETEPDLTPIMNLMVVLIPLLLTSAQFIKLGMIEINLPPAISASEMQNRPKEIDKRLDLTVTITDKGFYLASSFTGTGDEPTIPILQDGGYNFEELNKNLVEIKKQAAGVYKDSDRIIIVAEPDIDCQTVVSTMDAARMYKSDREVLPLFPAVSLSATVL